MIIGLFALVATTALAAAVWGWTSRRQGDLRLEIFLSYFVYYIMAVGLIVIVAPRIPLGPDIDSPYYTLMLFWGVVHYGWGLFRENRMNLESALEHDDTNQRGGQQGSAPQPPRKDDAVNWFKSRSKQKK